MTSPLRFAASPDGGEVDALLDRPAGARALLVLGHGAGSGMRHAFLVAYAGALHARGLATFRYRFPYRQAGRKRPDPRAVLLHAARAAAEAAAAACPDLPLYAGGKSMGGRMTSLAAAERPLPGVRGLVFVGFPLHPSGRPGRERAVHLSRVGTPLLFLQGTRDKLAGLDLLRPVCAGLGDRAHLHVVEGADHGFAVLKRSGRTGNEVIEELANATAGWIDARP